MIDDTCLTLGIHPYSILLEAEETGRLFVGENVKLSLYVIRKMTRASETFHKAGGGEEGRRAVCREKEGL